MRLIDADAFKQKVAAATYNEGDGATEKAAAICKLIDSQKTAYDVDIVVKALEKSSEKMSQAKLPHNYYKAVSLRKAIGIVRNGHKEEMEDND